jgi:hypothetical protein
MKKLANINENYVINKERNIIKIIWIIQIKINKNKMIVIHIKLKLIKKINKAIKINIKIIKKNNLTNM